MMRFAILLMGFAGFAAIGNAAAQPVPGAALPSSPPAWSIAPAGGQAAVRIASTARDGVTRFLGGCSRRTGPGLGGALSGYSGGQLGTIGQPERVLFYVRGKDWQDAFAVQLRYSATDGSWSMVKPLPPVFLDSFARGQALAVLNSQRQEIVVFDLTGSSNAAQALRATCGGGS